MQLKPLDAVNDNRGTLVEAFKFPHDGQLFYVVIKPNETRGNHYHERKTEHFLVVSGSAQMLVRDRSTGNVMKVEASGSSPLVMTIAPNHTHSITATSEGAIVLVWVDEQYNSKDPDTVAEEV